MRITFFKLSLFALFIVLGVYIFYLQAVKGDYYRFLSKGNTIRIIPEEGARGKILDRNMLVLVDNYLSFDVAILSADMKDQNTVFKKLSEILDVTEPELRKRFSLRYLAPFSPVDIAENVSRTQAIKIEMFSNQLPGVILRIRPKRNYPYAGLAAQAIGHLGQIDYWRLTKLENYGYQANDVVGYGGVEERYDYYLRPVEGGLQVEADHRGRFKRTLGYKHPENGKDLQLTIDIHLQKIIEENLSGRTGAIVVMEPSTGEILAMASYPSFEPAIFLEKSANTLNKVLTSPDAPLLNRAISAALQPGSVFKPITAIAGLTTGKIEPGTTYYCPGSMRVGRRVFSCWNNHGIQNLYQAVAHSCDVYFYNVGLAVGAQALHESALKFGLGKPTGIDLPEEAGGFIPSPAQRKAQTRQNWYDGDTANFSIGQGQVLTTPIQLARMMAVFANGGYLVTPYIVKSIDGKDVSANRRKIIRAPVNKRYIDILHKALREVVEDEHGTADILNMKKVEIAGKTGTAEAPPRQPHSWFAGFFPYESPRFVMCIFLEHGGSSHYSVAMAKKIIEKMLEEGLL